MGEWEELVQRILTCTDCSLCQSRIQAVPGEGPRTPQVMFVGEGPGFHEDQQGRPFVGPAGKLLDRLLEANGLRRQDVYITNVVKCRPPNNREPLPSEVEACRKYLERQVALLHPRLVVTLGRSALAWFFPRESLSKAHGQPRPWNNTFLFPTYHPAAALHYPAMQRPIEEDFRKLPAVLQRLQEAPASEGPPQQLALF